MKTQTRTWQRLSAAIIVAIGIAVVWGILAMWIASFSMLSSRANGTYENIIVLQDGHLSSSLARTQTMQTSRIAL